MKLYEQTRHFYAYVCKILKKEKASISLYCEALDENAQTIMDALAFDGACIWEGKKQDADGLIDIKNERFYLKGKQIECDQFASIPFHHGYNAVITKEESL